MNREPSDGIPVAAEALRGLVRALAEHAGAPEAQAALLADLLVGNDLRGVFSHGSRQIATYARHLRDGRLNPRPQVRTLDESAATLLLDGDAGLGYFPAWEAAHRLVAKAREVAGTERATLPGRLEWERERRWAAEGIPVGGRHRAELSAVAAEFGLPVPW